ncbi:MAG: hypothetical protein ACRC3B_18685 [Bacteroidia bacterium]
MKKKIYTTVIIRSDIASEAALQQVSPKLAVINAILAKYGSPSLAVRSSS